MDQKKIGAFIALCRKRKKLTQQQLADELGVTNKTISRWENGNYMPDVSMLEPLSRCLDINVNELLAGEFLQDQGKDEKTIISLLNYVKRKGKRQGLVFLILGLLVWVGANNVFGLLCAITILAIGAWNMLKSKRYKVYYLVTIVFGLIVMSLGMDVYRMQHHIPPILAVKRQIDQTIRYQTPLMDFYIVDNSITPRYTLLDKNNQYDLQLLSKVPFNLSVVNVSTLLSYKTPYLGDNSKVINLLSHLPLQELGFVIKIDDVNLGLKVFYSGTDWYLTNNMYLEKSLVFNTIMLFSLIDNLSYLEFNFSGNSFYITRLNYQTVMKTIGEYAYLNQTDNNGLESKLLELTLNEKIISDLFKKFFE